MFVERKLQYCTHFDNPSSANLPKAKRTKVPNWRPIKNYNRMSEMFLNMEACK